MNVLRMIGLGYVSIGLFACDHVNDIVEITDILDGEGRSDTDSSGGEEPVSTDSASVDPSVATIFTGETGAYVNSARIVGDLDGDGMDDFVIGDSGGSGPSAGEALGVRGAVYLFYGSAGFETAYSVTEAAAILRGAGEMNGGFRKCDLNGDGLNDFVVPGTGNAVVIYGQSSRLSGEYLTTDAGSVLQAPPPPPADPDYDLMFVENFITADCLGDLNNDGLDDLFVTQRTADSDGVFIHKVYFVMGRSGHLPSILDLQASADAHLTNGVDGWMPNIGLAPAGDIDGDGYVDLLVNVGKDNNLQIQTRLYYGGPNRFVGEVPLDSADAVFEAEYLWTNLGMLGDLNHDGLDDFGLVAYPSNVLYIVFGRGTRFGGGVDMSVANIAVSSASSASYLAGLAVGDFDNDGVEDLFIGDPHNDKNRMQSGAVFLVYGDMLANTNEIILGDDRVFQYGLAQETEAEERFESPENLGYGVTAGGDVNADGYDDVMFAAPGNVIGDAFGGSIYLRFGGPRP